MHMAVYAFCCTWLWLYIHMVVDGHGCTCIWLYKHIALYSYGCIWLCLCRQASSWAPGRWAWMLAYVKAFESMMFCLVVLCCDRRIVMYICCWAVLGGCILAAIRQSDSDQRFIWSLVQLGSASCPICTHAYIMCTCVYHTHTQHPYTRMHTIEPVCDTRHVPMMYSWWI